MNLIFTRTVTEHNITIPIWNDNVVEVTEQFIVYLTLQSSNAVIAITPARATVNVRNDDGSLPLITIIYYLPESYNK